ncbi:MAG: hypothetical protein RMJ55_13400 [Roseiflexaceae bacterium]|nr:hypothetical protein [Roseiflexus sp.]MCS7289016.1 hypothetical protein [Roseiflexus sp.]MDW8148438.1 hypothetical protein [Roseiflexaceae bacterium]MDW8214549.1 hypothetical protein [Roseiflexaceae bacterium]
MTLRSRPTPLALAADVRQRDQLAALRHLRPGVPLTYPRGPLARRLFADLLALDDEIDPLPWLVSARAPTVALLTLALALDFATFCAGYRGTLQRALASACDAGRSAALDVETRDRALFGRMLSAPDEWLVPDGLFDRIDAGDADELRRFLRQLRVRSELSAEALPQRSLIEPTLAVVLADLLRLPDTVDPVAWLATTRSDAVARICLYKLLQRVIPTPQQLSAARGAAVRPPFEPRLRLRAGPLTARLERMEFYHNGFRLHFRVRIVSADAARMMVRPVSPVVLTMWEGVTGVVDDAGHRYVMQVEDYQVTNQCWWWRQKLTLVGWPALNTTRSITLLAQPLVLTRCRTPQFGDQLIPLAAPELGAIRLRVLLL